MKKIGLVLTGLYLSVSAVSAEVVSGMNQEADMPLDSLLSHGTLNEAGIIRPLISLAIVIGLIYLTAFIYKRLSRFNATKFSKENKPDLNKFKLVSSQPLGANKTLHVVEINGKYLVLGSTANSINLIKEFDKAAVDNPTSLTSKTLNEACGADESDWVSEMLDKYNDKDGGENEK